MRSLKRRLQDVYFVERTKDDSTLVAKYIYGIPIKKRMAVSGTSGTVQESYFGILPSYDRYIVNFDMSFKPSEGTMVYVDKTPELEEDKSITLNDNGDPTVKPDYMVKKLAWTKRGTISRIGLEKVSDNDG